MPEAELLYASLIPAEEVPVYHACPGSVAARFVAAGAPWRCRLCRWAEIASAEGLVVRRVRVEELLSRLRIASPSLLVLDGPEPLASLGEAALALPRLAERLLPSVEAAAVYTMGLLGPGPLRRAAEAGYRVALFEYTVPLERPPGLDRVLEALAEAYRVFDVLEVIVHHDGSREATVALSGLVERYPEAGFHVYAREGAEDKAYEAAARVRDKHGVNVYVHPDESYTLSDTVCTSCGAVLVERKPWGVKVEAERTGRGLARCPRCGAEARLIPCSRPARRGSLHREVVVW